MQQRPDRASQVGIFFRYLVWHLVMTAVDHFAGLRLNIFLPCTLVYYSDSGKRCHHLLLFYCPQTLMPRYAKLLWAERWKNHVPGTLRFQYYNNRTEPGITPRVA